MNQWLQTKAEDLEVLVHGNYQKIELIIIQEIIIKYKMNKNKNMIRLILEQEKKISLKYRNQSLYQARNKMYKNTFKKSNVQPMRHVRKLRW